MAPQIDNAPIQAELVLIGGGHAQIAVLKSFGMRPVPGLRLTLITDVVRAPYSGMLPGHIDGQWAEDEMHVDLRKLARFAGARLIESAVIGLDPIRQMVKLKDRPDLRYDILSINSGAAPDLSGIKGAERHAIAVKPIAHFLDKLPAINCPPERLSVIGGGAAGVELALAFRKRWPDAAITLFSRSAQLLSGFPLAAHHKACIALKDADITYHLTHSIAAITKGAVITEDGREHACDAAFLVTPAGPAKWLDNTGLVRDESGFICVRNTLQTTDFDNIFASGDVASLSHAPRPKAGVFAVRAGPVLAQNIRRLIENRDLKPYRPQRQYLALIGLANGQALAVRGRWVMQGHFWHRLKRRIDKAFMLRYQDLPEMAEKAQRPLPFLAAQSEDPVFEAMRCAGCGAKAGPEILKKALFDAYQAARAAGARIDPLSEQAVLSDSVALPFSDGAHALSLDMIQQMVDDPYIFGQIAVQHALSDLFVSGARPLYAQALVQLAYARQELQQSMLTALLTGVLVELDKAGVQLAGGHTAEAAQSALGFAVTGKLAEHTADEKPLPQQADIILTKPLGSGLTLAADMRGLVPADAYQMCLEVMLHSNQMAAEIGQRYGAMMSDVTGFGLGRHLLNLMEKQGYGAALLQPEALPILPHCARYLKAGIRASLYAQNRDSCGFDEDMLSGTQARMLFDPQTSGGVVMLVALDKTAKLCAELTQAGYLHASVIGRTELGEKAYLSLAYPHGEDR